MASSGRDGGSRRRSREDFESDGGSRDDFKIYKKNRILGAVGEEKSPPRTPARPIIISHSDHLQFSPASTSTPAKHSPYTRPSPSSGSIVGKPYDVIQSLLAGNFDGKEDRIEQAGSMALMVAEHRSEISETGIIYGTVRNLRDGIVERLKELCSESFEGVEEKIESTVKPTISVAIEMADATSLLKLVSSSLADKLENAQKQATTAAMLSLEAVNLLNHALELLSVSRDTLKHTLKLAENN